MRKLLNFLTALACKTSVKQESAVADYDCLLGAVFVSSRGCNCFLVRVQIFPREGAIIGMLSKRTPFASQKDYICLLKGLLLEGKRTRFAMQKDSFFRENVKCQVLNVKCQVLNVSETETTRALRSE